MPVQWTDTLDKKLLLACISANDAKFKSWDKVAALMGPGYTSAACSQHFAKIKTQVGPIQQHESAPSTPTKLPTLRKKPGPKPKDVQPAYLEIDDSSEPGEQSCFLKKEEDGKKVVIKDENEFENPHTFG